jgi:vacuolar iron transporter family protein
MKKHFKGKEAVEHVIERRAKGIVATAESHGTEMPGHVSAAADAAKETAIALLLLWMATATLGIAGGRLWAILGVFSLAWFVWKIGRSAWLGWARLERLHRVIEEERWEIEHHRGQEREELRALYAAKGFDGDLLEEVVDVLMADGDRLLRVMLEEELGLFLQVYEHPLKQGVGAGVGALVAIAVCLIGFAIWPFLGLLVGAFLVVAASGATAATYEGNRLLAAIVWNAGLAALSLGLGYFSLLFILRQLGIA